MSATTLQDRILIAADQALRTLTAPSCTGRPSPAENLNEPDLTPEERKQSTALMRVNHAGEIAAQALYSGQAIFARADKTREHLLAAAAEEEDHLAWCAERIEELGGHRSMLDPVWYAGSFILGMIAGSAGDERSLGFIAETEDQVEAHLTDHLGRMPDADTKSKAILDQMAADEANHGAAAREHGGVEVPQPIKSLMSVGGEILRKTALKL